MFVLEFLLTLVTVYTTLSAVYLLVFFLAASLCKPIKFNRCNSERPSPTMAVLIPARNMAHVITPCVNSLLACHYPLENVTIYVIADHCTDDTAARAEAVGATVLTREEGQQGKTYTLAWAIDRLAKQDVTPELYIIVDATAQVDPSFLAALAQRYQQGADIVTSRAAVSPTNQRWYARCLGLMLIHRNLQSWCREQLGLSAWIEGRGMAYSHHYIHRFGWQLALPTGLQTAHPTEDWRHGVRAAEQGFRVAFTPDAVVVTPLRPSLMEATKQGARWERGRSINAMTHGLRLLRYGLMQRQPIKVFAALDAIQPPVALLGALASVIALSEIVLPGLSRLGLWAFVPFTLTCLYGLIVAIRGHREGIHFVTTLWAPLYIAWRCTSFVLAWVFLDRLHHLGPLKSQSRPSPEDPD